MLHTVPLYAFFTYCYVLVNILNEYIRSFLKIFDNLGVFHCMSASQFILLISY